MSKAQKIWPKAPKTLHRFRPFRPKIWVTHTSGSTLQDHRFTPVQTDHKGSGDNRLGAHHPRTRGDRGGAPGLEGFGTAFGRRGEPRCGGWCGGGWPDEDGGTGVDMIRTNFHVLGDK